MLSVKGKPGTLAQDMADWFTGFEQTHWQAVVQDDHTPVNNDPARLDIRACWLVSKTECLS